MKNNKHNPLPLLGWNLSSEPSWHDNFQLHFCTWNVTAAQIRTVSVAVISPGRVLGSPWDCTSTKGNRKRSHHTILKTQILGVAADSNPAPGTNTEPRCRAAVRVWQNEKQASLLPETTPPILPGAEGTDLSVIVTCSASE